LRRRSGVHPSRWNADDDLLLPSKGEDQTADTAISKGRSGVHDPREIVQGSTNRANTTTTS
jgi:hypothetical protein